MEESEKQMEIDTRKTRIFYLEEKLDEIMEYSKAIQEIAIEFETYADIFIIEESIRERIQNNKIEICNLYLKGKAE